MDHPYRPPTTHAALSGLDTGLLSAVAARGRRG